MAAFALPCAAGAQSVAQALKDLRSPVTEARINSLGPLTRLSTAEHFPLCSPQASREVRDALIDGLTFEDSLVSNGAPGSMTEDEVDSYYGGLANCVGALHDQRAVPALMGAMLNTGGMEEVVESGDSAVTSLIQVVDSRLAERSAAVIALGKMVAGDRGVALTAAHRQLIRTRLLNGLSDPSIFIRETSIQALRSFPDAGVRAAIAKVASSDPSVVGKGATRRYPVREVARRWLKQDSLRATAVHKQPPPTRH